MTGSTRWNSSLAFITPYSFFSIYIFIIKRVNKKTCKHKNKYFVSIFFNKWSFWTLHTAIFKFLVASTLTLFISRLHSTPFYFCTPGRIRTCNLLIRSQTLYPVEPRVQTNIKLIRINEIWIYKKRDSKIRIPFKLK